MQCYLPQPDLLVPGSTAVLLKFVGCSRMHSWYSLIPVNSNVCTSGYYFCSSKKSCPSDKASSSSLIAFLFLNTPR